MIYKFKSVSSGNVIMLGPNGDAFLRLLGREPAAKGIIEPGDMPAALTALRAAIEAAEQRGGGPGAGVDAQVTDDGPPVSLRSRLWPMIDLLERAQRDDVPVVWGV